MYEWPLDKLDVVNSALSQTGDNLVASADNGSDEWNVASPAYERGLAYMIEGHSWRWAERVLPNLAPAANVPTDHHWDTAYNLPADFAHLIWVLVNDMPAIYELGMGPTVNNNPSGVQLLVNSQGGPPQPVPPQVPAPVTIKYISQTTSDPTFSTPTFVLALQMFVMSGIYRGLQENFSEADKLWGAALEMLGEAKTRHDQQMPKRALYNSRILAARRVRRPWPPTPGGWNGSGIPG